MIQAGQTDCDRLGPESQRSLELSNGLWLGADVDGIVNRFLGNRLVSLPVSSPSIRYRLLVSCAFVDSIS